MKPWCKIVEVDDQQVLFWIDWNCDDDNEVALHQQATNGSIQIDRKIVVTVKADATDEDLLTFQESLLATGNEHMARHVLSTLEEYTP